MRDRTGKRRFRPLRPGRLLPAHRRTYASRPADRYIECDSSLLTEISEIVLNGKDRALRVKQLGAENLNGDSVATEPAPDTEVYGVLVGRREASRLRIHSFRGLEISLARNRWGFFSEESRRSFAGLLARIRWDPDLSGLEPVGWFRSQKKATLSLSLIDLEIFNQFFGEPWQIGLVLQPGASVRARFFLRERDRSLRPQSGFRDVVIRRNAEQTGVLVDRHPARETAFAPELPDLPEFPVPSPGGSRKYKPLATLAAFLAAAAVGAGFWWLLRSANRPPQHPAAPPVTSRSASPGDQRAQALWSQWQNELKRQQPTGPDSLQDGLPPDPAAAPPSGTGAPPLVPPGNGYGSERRRPAADDTAPPPPKPLSALAAPRHSEPDLRRTPETTAADAPLSRRPPASPPAAPPAPREKPNGISESNPTSTPARSASPVWTASNAGSGAASAPLPKVPAPASAPAPVPAPGPSSPAAPSNPSNRLKPLPAAVVPQTAPVHPAAAKPPPIVPSAPSSGRLIWTGRLHKNEYLTFEGGHVSEGSFSGALPGKPVALSVSPGNLTKNGLVIYTDRKPADSITQEAPGPGNGWNRTTLEWAPDRANDLEVVEAPGPSNGWKKLVLRVKNSRAAIIRIDWTAVP